MQLRSDTQKYSGELKLQFRSMVAIYFYDLNPFLGGYAEGIDQPVGLKEGLSRLKVVHKILLGNHKQVFITRRSGRFPISVHNIDFGSVYSSACLVPKETLVMRFQDVLLTSEEVSDIFNIRHGLLLKKARALESDSEILTYLLRRGGIAKL